LIGDRWPFAFADGLTGAVQAAESRLPPTIQFGDDAPLSLPSHGMYPVAYQRKPYGVVLQATNDQAYIAWRDGRLTSLGPSFGTDAVASTSWNAYYVVQSATWIATEFEGVAHPMPGGQGIAEILSDGTVIPFDARMVGVVHGLQVCRWSTSGRWTVAQHATRDLIVAHDGEQWMVAAVGKTVVAPRIVQQHDGSATMTCFPGYVARSADFTPYVEAAPTLPDVSRVPLLNRPFGIMSFCFNDVPSDGNLTIPVRPTSFEFQTPVVCPVEHLGRIAPDKIWAVYAQYGGDDAGVPVIVDNQAVAKLQNRALVVYQDYRGLSAEVVKALKGGIISTPFYRDRGESLDAFKSRCRRDYEARNGANLWPCVGIHKRVDWLSEVEVAEAFVACCELAHDQQWPGMLMFASGRVDVPVGVLRPYLSRLASGAKPAARPGSTPVTPPVIQPPFNPPVVIPPIKPPVLPTEPDSLFPRLRAFQGASMSVVNLIGPSGRYINIDPALPVGGSLPSDASKHFEEKGHENSAVTFEKVTVDGNTKYLLIAVKQSEVAGYPVVLSFPDSPGAVQTRPKDKANAGADEGVSLFSTPDGKQHVAMNVHTRNSGSIVFYPTTFTVVEV
jgi:hypothetical protein